MRTLLVAFVLSLSLPAFAQGGKTKIKSNAAEERKAKRADLLAELSLLNTDRKCEEDSQCEVLEVGVNPCGGPRSYIVVPTTSYNYGKIKAKAKEITAHERNMTGDDVVSECSDVKEPNPMCNKEKNCVGEPRK